MTLGLFDVAFLGGLSGGSTYDADAQDYINRVIAADVAAGNSSGLEAGVQDAINAFVKGCKADGTWPAIKASCILAGARTLQGCLVPLVGAAPTRFGTEGGWSYNRKTGLQGNGTNNYLDSNRNNNADPQNSQHMSVYATSAGTTGTRMYIGAGGGTGASGATHFNRSFANVVTRNRASAFQLAIEAGANTGFLAANRASSAGYNYRLGGQSATVSQTSETPFNGKIQVYANEGGFINDARLSFYSIGESLDLALLDARVTALMAALAAAIS